MQVSSTIPKRLIDYASCGGCAGKIPVDVMWQVVQDLPLPRDPDLLVGAEHFSDAGVYRLRDDLAIVNTVDFFPPMVNDPFIFGQIAAANALSDVYAMGAEPKTALNIVAFPDDKVETHVLQAMLRGASDRVVAAGAVMVGGHSLRDSEIKFGLAVTGVVRPDRMLTNAGASPGDVLVLTKGLGTGFAVAAYRAGQCPQSTLDTAIKSMTTLNRVAKDAALTAHAHGSTDVTGFGLAGHSYEMAQASHVTIRLDVAALPKLPGVESLMRAGHHSRATKTNRSFIESSMQLDPGVNESDLPLLFDAQTSGGLLISVAPRHRDALLDHCKEAGLDAVRVIGDVVERQAVSLIIRP